MNSKIVTALMVCALAAGASLFGHTETTAETARQQKRKAVSYSCPMHPEVVASKRGRCPKCGMSLRALNKTDEQKAPALTTSPAPTANPAETALKSTSDAPLKLRIPETTVYDQHGRKLNFYTDLIKGKTVAINFIFTTCTAICPSLSANFRRVQQTLGERLERGDIQLISISVDPATDVPERLKAFSEKFKAGPGWTFVTGSKPELDGLLSALGGYAPDRNNHTPLILIGNDAAGFWTRTYGLSPPSQIVNLVNDAAGKTRPALDATAKKEPGKQQQAAGAQLKTSAAETPANYFPNHLLLTQDNKPVRFYSDLLKGKVVLINFMFTTCKGVCSPMTANLARVQKYLGDRVGREVVMISLSVDQETDTTAVLKKYAESFKTQPGWYFLTGEKKNVEWVLYKLGGYVENKDQHSGVLIIGDEAAGEWMKVHAMANPTEIAAAVTKLLEAKKVRTTTPPVELN
jgi:protein SCO1